MEDFFVKKAYTFRMLTVPKDLSKRVFIVHEQSGVTLPHLCYKYGIEAHKRRTEKDCYTYALFEDYFALGKSGRHKLYAEWAKAQKKENNMGIANSTHALAETSTYVLFSNGSITYKDKKKEETMSTPELLDDKRRDYLGRRLHSIAYDKRAELKKPFNIDLNERPTNPKEFIQKMKDGQYVIPKSFLDEDSMDLRYFDLYDFIYSIEWRDPALKPDQKGYEAACEKLDQAKAKVCDIIMVKSPEEGLKALEEFEAATFH